MRKVEVKEPNTSKAHGMVGSSVFLLVCNQFSWLSKQQEAPVAIATHTFKQEWKQFVKFIFQTLFSWFRPEIRFFHLTIQAWLAASCRTTFSI